MLIEDLNGRDEPVSTYVFNGFTYRFKTQPDGRKVCAVNSQEHIGWMIGSGNFREYEPEEGSPQPSEPKADWEGWENEWLRLHPKAFVGYVEDSGNAGKRFVPGFVYQNIKTFDAAPKDILKRAIGKWNRQVKQLAEQGLLESPQRIWPGRAR